MSEKPDIYFNTTLVLFKPFLFGQAKTWFLISIPHWFYSNTKEEFAKLRNEVYFNTTLVLFKLHILWMTHPKKYTISIPHWFYSNLCSTSAHILIFLSISIPHWFYSNNNLEYLLKDLEFKFQYHTGSIQT